MKRRLIESLFKMETASTNKFRNLIREGKPWRGEFRKMLAFKKERERLAAAAIKYKEGK